MRTNTIRTRWEAGEAVLSAWLSIPSAFSAELVAHTGFDCITIDTQHGLIDYSAAVSHAAGDLDHGLHSTGTRALERAGRDYEAAGCRDVRHYLPDGQHGRGGGGVRLVLPLSAGGHSIVWPQARNICMRGTTIPSAPTRRSWRSR